MGRRVAILSDIHGNLEALHSVLRAAHEMGVEQLVCVGDLVGYGADPGPCIDTARAECRAIVAGNHDHAAAGLEDLNYFNPVAKEAMRWTIRELGSEHKQYLGRLPLLRHVECCALVHATPLEPETWGYVMTVEDALRQRNSFEEKICFIGHSHVPFVFEFCPSGHAVRPLPRVKLSPDCRYLVNVGSVGQPRDGDPRAAFCVYDLDAGSLEIVRTDYPISSVQKKILDAGLPPFLAQRLALGA
jgi:predicted phosphodiesterase